MAKIQSLADTWGTDMVTVLVGPGEKKFILHKKLLCKEAPFFNKMFNGSFEEAKTQECHLKDDEPFAFELVVSYIYTNRFPDDVKAVTGLSVTYAAIIKFYILADKLLMSKAAKTAALDVLITRRAQSGVLLHGETINLALAHTAMDCPLRKLVIDLAARDFLEHSHRGLDWLTTCLRSASREQTMQLMLAIKHVGGVKPTMSEAFCTKMLREKRSITSVPEYRIGYLKN